MSDIRVVILAGGRGSRLGEYTDIVPKPMVKIQGVPIIERIIQNFQKNGIYKFIISAGYKHEVILKHFYKNKNVQVVDTGEETQTAGRILGTKNHLRGCENFMACYGDGLTDYDPFCLYKQHVFTGATCTLLTVHPTGRFGEIDFNPRGLVTRFSEKPISDRWISGGYFCFSKNNFEYLSMSAVLETDIFPRLVEEKKMFCDSHSGFWKSLDTPKDLAELNSMELP